MESQRNSRANGGRRKPGTDRREQSDRRSGLDRRLQDERRALGDHGVFRMNDGESSQKDRFSPQISWERRISDDRRGTYQSEKPAKCSMTEKEIRFLLGR